MKEIWKKIEEYPQYEVSSIGGWRNTERNYQPKGRKNNGYINVHIGNKKEIGLHILVAKHFPEICGEWFEGCQVHHKNFNKLDNRAENLIVLSKSEHQKLHYKNAPDTFTKSTQKRITSIKKALTGRIAIEKHIPIVQFENNKIVGIYENGKNAALKLNKSQGNISSCCKGHLKSAYGYQWVYLNTYLADLLELIQNEDMELEKAS